MSKGHAACAIAQAGHFARFKHGKGGIGLDFRHDIKEFFARGRLTRRGGFCAAFQTDLNLAHVSSAVSTERPYRVAY